MHNGPVRRRGAEASELQQYGRLLRFLGTRLSNGRDAEELAQEAYLRLLRASDSKLIRDPVAYLFRIAGNLLYEWYASMPPETEPLDALELADGTTVEEATDIARDMERLATVLGSLSPKRRAAILMHRRDGMTYDEVADALGISSSMVKKHLSRGLAQCRAEMRRIRGS